MFRSSHLYVPYTDERDKRGNFTAFDRERKKYLYALGSKFTDYTATAPNFHGRFFKNSGIVNEEEYENAKGRFISDQHQKIDTFNTKKGERNIALYILAEFFDVEHHKLAKAFGYTRTAISKAIQSVKKSPVLLERAEGMAKKDVK